MVKYKFYIILFFIIVFLSFFASVFLPKRFDGIEQVIFSIEKGEGSKEIALNLEKEGIIRWGPIFRAYVLVAGKSKRMQVGDYEISPLMSVYQIAEKFSTGETIKTDITIIEGWTLADIGEYLVSKEIIEKGKYFYGVNSPLDNKDFSSDYDFLADKPKNKSLEGYFFPDTYEINRDATVEEITKKVFNNFGKKLNTELREEITRQNKTIFDIITMASLIEREVRTKEDKEIVSGILWKRLKIGMPLQVDAAILYITGKKGVSISIEDTKIDSPYNTYKYAGLPAGPICNPGLDSIKTAIYPKDSNYLYYLSAPDGKTIFSKTLEEHNIAKVKYLK